MKTYSDDNFSDIYRNILYDLKNNYEYKSKPRSLEINELTNVTIELKDIYSSLFCNKIRSTPLKYLAAELLWYLSGSNDSSFITKYSSFWKKIMNDDNTINSAYGHLLFIDINRYGLTQWEWATNSLLNDKDSRQAIIHFNNSSHQYFDNKDFVCTMYGIFNIRNNKLNLTICQRSCDVIKGLTFDLPFFTVLLQLMFIKLKEKYVDLEIGNFYHIINSLHVYENDFNLISNMLDFGFTSNSMPKVEHDIILSSDLSLIINNNYNSNDNFLMFLNKHLNYEKLG